MNRDTGQPVQSTRRSTSAMDEVERAQYVAATCGEGQVPGSIGGRGLAVVGGGGVGREVQQGLRDLAVPDGRSEALQQLGDLGKLVDCHEGYYGRAILGEARAQLLQILVLVAEQR